MNNFTLKWIAILCMLIDHIGAVFTPGEFNLFRIIGRLAFPIFCFLLVEGFHHTHSVKKYLIRLGLFVPLSEIPFDLAFHGRLELESQNVFFTLFIGMLVIYAMSRMEKKLPNNLILYNIVSLPVIALGCYLALLLHTDYNMWGVLLIVAFYVFRENFLVLSLVAVVLLLSINIYEIYAVLSLVLIYLYNGKKGPSMKYFFYVFYPGHLILLYLLSCFLKHINPLQFLV